MNAILRHTARMESSDTSKYVKQYLMRHFRFFALWYAEKTFSVGTAFLHIVYTNALFWINISVPKYLQFGWLSFSSPMKKKKYRVFVPMFFLWIRFWVQMLKFVWEIGRNYHLYCRTTNSSIMFTKFTYHNLGTWNEVFEQGNTCNLQ